MKRILLFVLLLTNYCVFGQDNNCPKPELYISSLTEDGESIWDEYGTGLDLCKGSTMNLIPNFYNQGLWKLKSVRWTGPNNVNSSSQSLKLSKLEAKHEGYYTLTATFQGCGTITVTTKKKIIVKLPAVTLTEAEVCLGSDVKLEYFEADSYPYREFRKKSKIAISWTGPNNFKSNEAMPVLKNVRESGIYTATINYSGFCVGSYKNTKKVDITTTSQVRTNHPYTSCTQDEAVLTAIPSVSGANAKYIWEGPDGFLQEGQEVKVKDINKKKAGIYKVKAHFTGGCTNIDSSIAIVRIGNPDLSFGQLYDFCEGMDVNLPAVNFWSDSNLNLKFNWTGPNNFSSNENSPLIRNFSKEQSGIYHLEIESSGFCAGLIKKDFYLAPINKPKIESKIKEYCVGNKIKESLESLSEIKSSYTYSWKGPNNFSSNGYYLSIDNFDKAKEGIYTLTLKVDGCEETTTSNIELKLPTSRRIEINTEKEYCKGSTVQLNAYSYPSSGSDIFQWEGPNNFKATGYDITIDNFQPEQAGEYKVTVSSIDCPSTSKSIPISVIQTPDFYVPAINNICKGLDFSLYTYPLNYENSQSPYGSYPSNSAIKYEWTGPNNYKSDNSYLRINNFDKSKGGQYTLKVTITGHCAGETIKKTNLIENEPSVEWSVDKLCNGKTVITPHFENISGKVLQEIKVFDSNNNEVSNIIDAQSIGIYTVKAKVQGECNFENEKQIDISQAKPFKLTLPEITRACQNYSYSASFHLSFPNNEGSYFRDYIDLNNIPTRLYLSWTKPDNSIVNKYFFDVYNPQKSDEGIYKVSGTFVGECTGTYEAQTQLIVETEKPQVNFDLMHDKMAINLENKTQGYVSSFYWDFGDDRFSEEKNPGKIIYAKEAIYSIGLKATNACGTSSLIKSVNISNEENPILSNEKPTELLSFTVSPNPSAGMVEISNPNKLDVQISVHSMDGKTLGTFSVDSSQATVTYDFSNYVAGVYLIKCMQKNGQVRTRKIVIHK